MDILLCIHRRSNKPNNLENVKLYPISSYLHKAVAPVQPIILKLFKDQFIHLTKYYLNIEDSFIYPNKYLESLLRW